jgi:CDP-glycerol glycerophosphotransferase (TagB/SpsB family)
MIKNRSLKRFLKASVIPLASFINTLVPKKSNLVLLYTANGKICYSLIPLRDYLLEHGFDRKYQICCGVSDMKYAEDIKGVRFISGIKNFFVFFRASHVFYSAGQLPIKPTSKQIVIHMRHGNANFKQLGLLCGINNGDEFFFTYMISPSNYFIPYMAKEYGCSEKNIRVAGDPLCDQLLMAPRNSYDFGKFNKMLLWVPTFRQSDYYGHDDSKLEMLVPMFREDDYEELNTMLADHNILLIVKLHPGQTVSERMQRHYSHLTIFSHKEFCETKYDMYLLMAQSDGLIGDYSSASMQYLLVDRPLAFVVPDIEEYGKKRGFVFDHPEDYMGGHIIKNKEQFYRFLEDFAAGKDVYRDKRHWVCDHIYKYHDTNSCRRIVKLSGMSME